MLYSNINLQRDYLMSISNNLNISQYFIEIAESLCKCFCPNSVFSLILSF